MVCIRDSSLKKYAPLRREELIHKDDIDEVLYPLKESDTDYITTSGNVYKYYYGLAEEEDLLTGTAEVPELTGGAGD